jgi:quercetin dioxygenase-like cupin family protein
MKCGSEKPNGNKANKGSLDTRSANRLLNNSMAIVEVRRERTKAMYNMKKFILSLFVLSLVGTAAHAQTVDTLLTKKLPDAPGKEIQVIIVNYPPGAVDIIHRHHAHVVVYVLEGDVEMQVRGGTLQRLSPGQVFYESPEDVHTVGRNASKTKPAKFVVFFIKNEGAPILTPAH